MTYITRLNTISSDEIGIHKLEEFHVAKELTIANIINPMEEGNNILPLLM